MLVGGLNILYVLGILALAEGMTKGRPNLALKKQISPPDNARLGERIQQRSVRRDDSARRDAEEPDCIPDEPDDLRWRRDDWAKQEMYKQDPVIARQEDFERWLRKRGNVPVDQDPEAVRVASKQAELQELLQQLYEAQAAVKMETGEVSRTQQVAQEAQTALEEATNKVRMLSADLQSAQEGAAAAAMRAHTAQLQLSAHDQLMFTARQRVDALSAQMVSVQAELAAVQQAFTLNNSSHLLEAQGRCLESLQNNRPLPQRPMFMEMPQPVLGPPMSNLLDEKHVEVPSSPSAVNRPNFNFMYPQ